jgi:hypothetical protein
VLKNLDNPLLNGITLGLTIEEDQVTLQPGMFPCCAAQGMVWDERNCAYRSCDLRSRLHRVQKLMYQFRRIWPQSQRGPHLTTAPYAVQTLQELASVFRHDLPPGRLQYSSQRQMPSTLWTRALGSMWRFGVEARIINLQRLNPSELAAFTSEASGPLALFVEQVDKLWDPLLTEYLEHVIQRAYNAEAFLWVDCVLDAPREDGAGSDLSVKAAFSRKIAHLRNQHPLSFLSRDSLSRLESLCGGPLKMEH